MHEYNLLSIFLLTSLTTILFEYYKSCFHKYFLYCFYALQLVLDLWINLILNNSTLLLAKLIFAVYMCLFKQVSIEDTIILNTRYFNGNYLATLSIFCIVSKKATHLYNFCLIYCFTYILKNIILLFIFSNNRKFICTEIICPICLDKVHIFSSQTLKCNHIFHANCFSIWQNTSKSCPMCRTPTNNIRCEDGTNTLQNIYCFSKKA